jgi:hypothetical protein
MINGHATQQKKRHLRKARVIWEKIWRLFSFADALKNEKISAKSKFTKCLKIVCAK